LSTDPTDSLGPASTEVTFRPFALTSATVDLVVFGMISSLFGPLLVTLAQRFHLSLAAAGVVLSVYFVGAFFGVPIGWLAMRRFTGAAVLSGTLLITALGACGAALSTDWAMFLSSVFLLGLGFGGVDFSLISLLVRTRMSGRGRRLSVINAGYGLGAVIGPLLVVVVRPHDYRLLYVAIALSVAVLTLGNRGLIAPPLSREHRRSENVVNRTQRRAILGTFIAAYICYVATETTTAGWIAPHLHRIGYSASLGSVVTAGFWLGLAVGRVLAGPISRRHSDHRLVLGGLLAAVALCLIALVNGAAPYVYPLVGLSIALVYPLALVWYSTLCPHDDDGVALLILCMMAGGVIGPAVQSVMVSTFGVHVVPIVLASFAALTLGTFASALRFRVPESGVNPGS
jgi:FHS family glucose/mannose:H+ symporter-like MFS transporter